MRTKPTMYKRMLRSVLATAFVAALAYGTLGAGDISWSSQAAPPGDISWNVEAASAPGDISWDVEGAPGDISWGIAPANAGA
ncbi:hypothetical protein [Streptomyces sp. H27-C3]|uniref:hypothetical protein n=1 Tax=Streptomyces sp. H27-C3 TaxID=3046305 RepID=UPI0024B8BC9D|nr:hypothetical protein [Streptomyces sp. H27-C3]MDJ0466782.1 hypothetical protein [Streptomyces sp. H27-C3]